MGLLPTQKQITSVFNVLLIQHGIVVQIFPFCYHPFPMILPKQTLPWHMGVSENSAPLNLLVNHHFLSKMTRSCWYTPSPNPYETTLSRFHADVSECWEAIKVYSEFITSLASVFFLESRISRVHSAPWLHAKFNFTSQFQESPDVTGWV